MRLYESPGELKRLRRIPWRFQQTFETPSEDDAELGRFVDTIMSALPKARGAIAVLAQVVFQPDTPDYGLLRLYRKYSIPEEWYGNDLIIQAEDAAQVRELLEALLSEMIDFLLVPTPRPFVIYSDHDDYMTFLAQRKGHLNSVVGALKAAKFCAVDYVRKL